MVDIFAYGGYYEIKKSGVSKFIVRQYTYGWRHVAVTNQQTAIPQSAFLIDGKYAYKT